MSNNVWDLEVYITNLLIDTVPDLQKTETALESMGLTRVGNYGVIQLMLTSPIRQKISGLEDPELTKWKSDFTKKLKEGLETKESKVIAVLNLQPMIRTVILQLSSKIKAQEYKEEMTKRFQALLVKLDEVYNFQVIGCTSRLFTDFFRISAIYRAVRQVQAYHYCIGSGCNIFYEDLDMTDGPDLVTYKYLHLFDKLLQGSDWHGVNELICRITDSLKEHPAKDAKTAYIYKEMFSITIRHLFEEASTYQYEIQQLNEGITMFDEIFDDVEQMQLYYLGIMTLLSLEHSNDQLHPHIRKVLAIVHSEYKEPLTLEGIADRIGITSAYLSRLFKSEMTMNFKSYLTDFRIELAKKALVDTNKKIEVIRMEVGYQSQSQFDRAFNKVEGMPPSEFRQFYKG